MNAHLSICPIGIFASGDNGNIFDKELFERNSSSVANKFIQLRGGKIIPELQILYSRVQKKSSEITIESENNFGLNLISEIPNPCGKTLRKNINKLAAEFNFPSAEHFAYNLSLDLTEKKLSTELAKPDKLIIQIVNAIDELNENLNISVERFNELKLLNLSEKNKSILQQFNSGISNVKNTKKYLEQTLEKLMQENFKNLNAVATPSIGAKLISIAGDSSRLSKMASSKIQVLGAEKALFRHLKSGAKSPKYGVILRHPLLSSAPQHFRGKIARILAAKISIAIKADVYGKEFIGDELKKSVSEKIAKIKGAK